MRQIRFRNYLKDWFELFFPKYRIQNRLKTHEAIVRFFFENAWKVGKGDYFCHRFERKWCKGTVNVTM